MIYKMPRIFKREMQDNPPMTSYDPGDAEEDPDPLPLPPDSSPRPAAPVREPDDDSPPITDPSMPEPTRLG